MISYLSELYAQASSNPGQVIFFGGAIIFLVGYYRYYSKKKQEEMRIVWNNRTKFLKQHPELPPERVNAVNNGEPWIGMKKEDLLITMGNPNKIRVLHSAEDQEIWTFPTCFVYLKHGKIMKWKKK